jgi:outer membrane protein OmpA-like peptidoglycan-associated protein
MKPKALRKVFTAVLSALASLGVAAGLAWGVGGADMIPPAGGPVVASATGSREAIPKLEGFVPTSELGAIYFDFDRSAIRPTDAKILDRHAERLKANSTAMLAIEGGVDQRGSMPYNQKLSERRARAVSDYLIAHGVPAERIVSVGYGNKVLECKTPGEQCWQKNRQVDFLVKTMNKQAP